MVCVLTWDYKGWVCDDTSNTLTEAKALRSSFDQSGPEWRRFHMPFSGEFRMYAFYKRTNE